MVQEAETHVVIRGWISIPRPPKGSLLLRRAADPLNVTDMLTVYMLLGSW